MSVAAEEHREEHRGTNPAYPNLRAPWQPGQSGNPGGRPKGRSLTSLLRERLDEVDERTQKTFAELIVQGWIDAGIAGNVPAIKEVLDRTEGKVTDRLEVDDVRKAYVVESPDTLWPSDQNNAPTSLTEPPDRSGETPDPKCS